MATHLFETLEKKINQLLDTVTYYQSKLADLEANQTMLEAENLALKKRQTEWEQGLTALLNKFPLPSVPT